MNITPIRLAPGMIFCTENPMTLGRAINTVQRFWSNDGESTYSHAGIIKTASGMTYEALWKIQSQNIYEAYRGNKVLIGRHTSMTMADYQLGMDAVYQYSGNWYPFHRIFMHMIPPLAKYVNTGRFMVCSELVDKFLFETGLCKRYRGRNPDHIADMIKQWREWDVVYEGVL